MSVMCNIVPKARSVQLKTVVISERVLGFDHPNTIQQYVSFGEVSTENICFVVGRVNPNHLFHIFRPSWVCMHLLEGRVFWPRNVSSGLVY